jgi:hypothetical protein
MKRHTLLVLALAACSNGGPAKSDPKATAAKTVETTKVEVPEVPKDPFFTLDDCVSDYSSVEDSASISVTSGDKSLDCRSFHGVRAKVKLHVNPGAKLQIAGRDVTVPATGAVETIVDFSDAILDVSIDDFAADTLDSKSAELTVPWKLEAGGKSIEGKLTLTEASYEHGKLYRQWLRDVSDGKIDHPSFTAAAKGERKTIALLDVDNRDITPTDRRGKVRDLDMVAVEKETKRTESGVCEFDTNGTVTRAKRFGVELEVTVSSLTDGHVVATKTFPAPSGCPSFEMLDPNDPKTAVRPRKEDITRWLESFVKS